MFLSKIFERPPQVRKRHEKIVRTVGRIGFFFKGFVYAFIGGLFVKSGISTVPLSQNESPQGVFIFLGSQPDVSGYIYLTIVLCGLLIYAVWRFWEGLTGQGYSVEFSKKKNFFKYRVSPLVSGAVYVSYSVFIIEILQKPKPELNATATESSCFPICWKNTLIGKIGLFLLGLAFSIAVVTQITMALGAFYLELNKVKLRELPILKWVIVVTGVIGFLARSLLFALVALLFWQVLFTSNIDLNPTNSTVAQALDDIRYTTVGKVIMLVLGMGLLVYGLFAVLCIYFKVFPTQPVQKPTETTLPE